MSTLFGNKKIKACYFGTKKIKEGRFGTKLICGKPFGFTKWRVQSFRGGYRDSSSSNYTLQWENLRIHGRNEAGRLTDAINPTIHTWVNGYSNGLRTYFTTGQAFEISGAWMASLSAFAPKHASEVDLYGRNSSSEQWTYAGTITYDTWHNGHTQDRGVDLNKYKFEPNKAHNKFVVWVFLSHQYSSHGGLSFNGFNIWDENGVNITSKMRGVYSSNGGNLAHLFDGDPNTNFDTSNGWSINYFSFETKDGSYVKIGKVEVVPIASYPRQVPSTFRIQGYTNGSPLGEVAFIDGPLLSNNAPHKWDTTVWPAKAI